MKTPKDYPMARNIMYKVDENGEIVPFKLGHVEPLKTLAVSLVLAALIIYGIGYGAIYYEDNSTHFVEQPQ